MQKLLFILFTLFFSSQVFSQTINMIIVTQTESAMNNIFDVNKSNMLKFATTLETYTGVDVKITLIDGIDATKSKIIETLDNINIDSNDVVWYYYTGRGMNYDTWPESDEGEVPLTWVHQKLMNTDARLTIAFYDCINYQLPISYQCAYCNNWSSLKQLFLLSGGDIIITSNSSDSYSCGTKDGSVFTISFLEALEENNSWSDVLESTTYKTVRMAQESYKTQKPKYEIKNMVEESDFRIAPGYFKIRKSYSSLDELAKAIEEMLKRAEPKLEDIIITKEDILRWNPTMTEENWKFFKKVYWDLEK